MDLYNTVDSNLRVFQKAKVCYEKSHNDIKDYGQKSRWRIYKNLYVTFFVTLCPLRKTAKPCRNVVPERLQVTKTKQVRARGVVLHLITGYPKKGEKAKARSPRKTTQNKTTTQHPWETASLSYPGWVSSPRSLSSQPCGVLSPKPRPGVVLCCGCVCPPGCAWHTGCFWLPGAQQRLKLMG